MAGAAAGAEIMDKSEPEINNFGSATLKTEFRSRSIRLEPEYSAGAGAVFLARLQLHHKH